MTYVNFIKPAYYDEFDEHAADWIENLIRFGVVAPGDVDRRSIEDVRPDDLRGYRQCHFFAGISVWSFALRRAGVPDDAPVWTGSPPCQPFSAAGKGAGVDDERHLWPAQFDLIRECRPPVFYGEQVASKDGLAWLDLVRSDLEGEDYAAGFLDTCSAGTGAPHIRQRLRICTYDTRSSAVWLEHASGYRRNEWRAESGGWRLACGRGSDELDDAFGAGLEGHTWHGDGARGRPFAAGSASETEQFGILADTDRSESGRRGDARSTEGSWLQFGPSADGCSLSIILPDTNGGNAGTEWQQRGGEQRLQPEDGEFAGRIERPGPTNGFWRDADWLFCRDEQWRPTQPGSFPLVDGSAFRVGSGSAFEGKSRQGMLKGYGNAVDAEATTEFIWATFGSRLGSSGVILDV